MYHNFLIHSSADGHLGCFHVLAIVNSSTWFLKHPSLPGHYLLQSPSTWHYIGHHLAFYWAYNRSAVFPSGSLVKNPPVIQELQETRVQSLGWEDILEKGMANNSSLLAWRISWTEEPGGLQSMGSQRVGYDFACVYWTVTSSNFKGTLEEEMATHSSVLAWRIPGTGEPGGLLSMGSHRVGHDWSDLVVVVVVWQIYFQFLKESPDCSP